VGHVRAIVRCQSWLEQGRRRDEYGAMTNQCSIDNLADQDGTIRLTALAKAAG
jgi:hypothetical protein